jgi:NitT/TauT family transport system substrate-binding protein
MAIRNLPTNLLLLSIMLIDACDTQAQSPPPLQHVSVRLNFLPGMEHAFLYLGKQKGWYAEQGIDLEVVPGQGSTVAVKTVGSGEDQFAIADTGSVARGWEAGVPLLYVAMLLKHTPAAIFSLPSRNIVAMDDLCGKKVGINLRSATAEQYHAMVRLAKLDCSIEEIPVSSGGSKEVLTNVVDAAVNFSYTDALRVKLKGGVNIIPATNFFDFFSLGFITNQKFLADNKDLARRFVSVTFRSLSYSFAHKDEAMEAFFSVIPEADRVYESAKFDTFRELAQDDDADHGVGPQSRKAWESTMRSLRDVGLTRSVLSVDGKVSDAAIR